MGFKEKIDENLIRFKEFDEARGFIEKGGELQDIQEAIDYMIVHKEFYFLLKELKSKDHLKQEDIVEYLFSRLPCLKREEDRKMILSFLECEPPFLKKRVVRYIFACCEEIDPKSVLDYLTFSEELLQAAIENGECRSVQEMMRYLRALNTEQKLLLEKFFEVYGSE